MRSGWIVILCWLASLSTWAQTVPIAGFDRSHRDTPPLKLTSGDGTVLRLVKLQARTVLQGPLAFTELHLDFENPLERVIEGRFEITLPEGAAVSRLAMKIDKVWQEAEVVELGRARVAYEDFLHRRQDPALLEKQAGNSFQARIFPIPPRTQKHLILSYSQQLTSRQNYVLRLAGLPQLEALELQAWAGGKKLEDGLKAAAPTGDWVIRQEQTKQGLTSGDLAAFTVKTQGQRKEQSLQGLLVLFDTSASRAAGYRQQIKVVTDLLKGEARVACFDQQILDLGTQPINALASRLEARSPLGATDLAGALRWAATQEGVRRLLIITDGVSTAGSPNLTPLVASLKKAGVERVDVILTGGIRDRQALTPVVEGLHGLFLDSELPSAELSLALRSEALSSLRVAVKGARWVCPDRLDGLRLGEERLVFAQLSRPMSSLQVTLHGPLEQSSTVSLTAAPRPLLERAAMEARITALTGDWLKATGRLRSDLAARIVDLSTRFRVVSDFTGLLVLETEADYARFGIDRRALADILTVGPGGLEVQHRKPVRPWTPSPARTVGPTREGLIRQEILLEKAPAEKVIAFLQSQYPSAQFTSHPTMNGLYVVADRRTILQIKFEVSNLDRVPDPPPPPEGTDQSPRSSQVPEGHQPARIPANPRSDLRQRRTDEFSRRHQPTLQTGRPSTIPDDILATAPGSPRVPPDSIRQEILLERAPAAKVIAFLESRYKDRAIFNHHPTMNGFYVMAERTVILEIKALLPTLDREGASFTEFPVAEPTWFPATQKPPPSPPPPPAPAPAPKPPPPALTGKLLEVDTLLRHGDREKALQVAQRWHNEEPGDVLALRALGQALAADGQPAEAARAYGSIIDLYPGRADLRRFAGGLLESVGCHSLASDTFNKAAEQRPDHPSSHRLLAFARLRQGDCPGAFSALERGLRQRYPEGRFPAYRRVLIDDLSLVAAVWGSREPRRQSEIHERLRACQPTGSNRESPPAAFEPASQPSLRFVLTWETDNNDVDFHIKDGDGAEADYRKPRLKSGGELFADVTQGYGPECFAISGVPKAFPYCLSIHYYSRGPMGYGMGQLQIIYHDGQGHLRFDDRPYVIMEDDATVNLGSVEETWIAR